MAKMTLIEAIKHCEEKEQEQALNGCFACAEEHKQLAEWLKELAEYQKLFESPKEVLNMMSVQEVRNERQKV